MTDLEKKAEKMLRAFLHYESNTSYEKLLSFPNKEQIIASHIAFAQWLASQNGWIEIKEDTEIIQDKSYIFMMEDGTKILGHLDEHAGQWWIYEDMVCDHCQDNTWSLHDFKYFMPLPPPPKL